MNPLLHTIQGLCVRYPTPVEGEPNLFVILLRVVSFLRGPHGRSRAYAQDGRATIRSFSRCLTFFCVGSSLYLFRSEYKPLASEAFDNRPPNGVGSGFSAAGALIQRNVFR